MHAASATFTENSEEKGIVNNMKITFDSTRRVFLISSSEMSYAIVIAQNGRLVNLYWGSAVGGAEDLDTIREELTTDIDRFGGMKSRPEYRSGSNHR